MTYGKLSAILSALLIVVFYCDGSFAGEPRKIILGASTITIKTGSTVGTQVERVIRDIAWKKSSFDEKKDANEIITDRRRLVPYMEGFLAGKLIDYAKVKIIGLTPAIGRRIGDVYYAENSSGKYCLAIDRSKTFYHTVRKIDNETIELVDTHGFNMLVPLALKTNRTEKLSLVIACMDLPSKAEAALELARLGINSFGPCDRFASEILGYRQSGVKEATIIGTAPIRRTEDGAIIGGQKITIYEKEPVIVQTTKKRDPERYCDTAARYFNRLRSLYKLDMDLTEIDASVGETAKLVAAATSKGAKVIGARVYNEEDARPLKAWLNQSKEHRLVLFHSAIFKPGYAFFFNYPEQTSFGDLDPIIE